ncbi:hypothetical protein MAR_030098 [Mya arenaria]|uniref:Uncharacterized protein n=1 Tax=Mya arenaria TaxID=6604 RepID=A0ABY7DMW3_MYAAR|nr:hypothetical protein MAR_030098 [Mya arenaria]
MGCSLARGVRGSSDGRYRTLETPRVRSASTTRTVRSPS